MGLVERKLIQKILETTAEDNEIMNQRIGFAIPITIDVASFPDNEKVLNDFFVRKVYGLNSIVNSISKITEDAMTKEAVQDQIKSITLSNSSKNYEDKGSKSVVLQNQTLHITCGFNNDIDSLYKPDQLAKEIEKLLL